MHCCARCWSSCSPTASSRSTRASCRYLTTRIERSFAAARGAVAMLDREALRQQRPVTRALAGELFRGRLDGIAVRRSCHPDRHRMAATLRRHISVMDVMADDRTSHCFDKPKSPPLAAAGRPRADESGSDLGGEPRALHQPRAVLAAFQSPRAGGGRERPASAARAGAVPVDLGQQSRRILHGARRRPQGPGARRASPTRSPDGLIAGRAARPHRRGGLAASPATSRRAGASCARSSGREASSWSTARQPEEGRPHLARGSFPATRLSGADAARDRSGASVPVHSQSRLHDRAAAVAHARRQADERADPRAAEDRPLHPPADVGRWRCGALHHARTGDRPVHRRGCSPATRSRGRARSASSATPTSRSRKRPRIWCGCSRARSSAAAAAR